jgi:soluble lytic murein transglycosylase-like protein
LITAQALAVCIFTAAQTYAVPPSVILGILHVEGGRTGQAVGNTNGTYDLGPMQINTIWIPELARYWRVSEKTALKMVRDDACVNIGVGAWILRSKMNQAGSLYNGIAWYHSATPHLGSKYRQKVVSAMQKYRLIKQPQDLVMAYNRSKSTRKQRG